MSKFNYSKTHFLFTILFLLTLFFLYIVCSLRRGTGEEYDTKERRPKKRRNKSCYNSQPTRCDVPCVATISAGE